MEENTTNPGHFGHGAIGAAAVAEEAARVARLEKLLGPAGVQAVGFEHAQRIYDAITGRRGQVPEFTPGAGAVR